MWWHSIIKVEQFLLFSPILLSSNCFSYLFTQYFAHNTSNHNKVFLLYLKLLSMQDCSIKVIYCMVTAPLKYFEL